MQTAKQLFPEMSPTERRQYLADNSDNIDEGTYYRTLTQANKDEKNAKVSADVMQIWRLEEDLAEISKRFQDQIKPLKKEARDLAYEVSTGQEKKTGSRFHNRDFEAGIVNIYDEEGYFLESRRLLPEERQQRIRMV